MKPAPSFQWLENWYRDTSAGISSRTIDSHAQAHQRLVMHDPTTGTLQCLPGLRWSSDDQGWNFDFLNNSLGPPRFSITWTLIGKSLAFQEFLIQIFNKKRRSIATFSALPVTAVTTASENISMRQRFLFNKSRVIRRNTTGYPGLKSHR